MVTTRKLGTDQPLKLLISFSIPATVGMLVQAMYNVISRIFIGNSVGTLGIAGITVAFPAMMIQMAFGFMIGMGATTLVSIRLGQNKKDEAEKIIGTTVLLLVLVSLLITVFGLHFLEPMLRLFGASEQVLPYAKDYLHIVLLGTVVGLMGFGMNNFIRAEGNPKKAMVTMLMGSVSNIILSPIFISLLGWGMKGAGIATVISQGISASWILLHFARGKGELKIRKKYLRIDPKLSTSIMYFGLSPFTMQLAQSLLNAVMNTNLRTYGGDMAISGMGIVVALMSLIMMPIMGINTGAQPLIGYNYGARKFDRVKEFLKYSIIAATVIAVIGFIFIRMFPTQLIAIFSSKDQALIDFGSKALVNFLIFLPIVGFQIVGAGYFQAIGKPVTAMILSLSRQLLVFIPMLLILPKFLGLNGVIASGPVADLISTIITGIWLAFALQDLNRKIQSNMNIGSKGTKGTEDDKKPEKGALPKIINEKQLVPEK
ncbi:MATE family efflux transporter [Dehalobacterium formicoaceticum]|uniref:Multidrug export protein MepA n=1 Tax=Dehalobacterium formicoaceticum TaxID=51515 RepID=A0ABT1Y4C6_9FIRM|nr:MATE family efflux transporter [Dehalobacterium formicoaceticum]MCR6545408.1 MATE family efflux transporter [Dehalobacterium formicoaceticum]